MEARVFSHQERVNNDCRLFHFISRRRRPSPTASTPDLAPRPRARTQANIRASRGTRAPGLFLNPWHLAGACDRWVKMTPLYVFFRRICIPPITTRRRVPRMLRRRWRCDVARRRRRATSTRARHTPTPRRSERDASGYFAFRSTLSRSHVRTRARTHESDNDELRAWSAMAMRAMATTTTTATTAAVRTERASVARSARAGKHHAFVRVTKASDAVSPLARGATQRRAPSRSLALDLKTSRKAA